MRDGSCLVDLPGQSEATTIGQIQLARFMNPDGLEEVLPGIYHETGLSGTATIGSPGNTGLAYLQQGWLSSTPRWTSSLTPETLPLWIGVGLSIWVLVDLKRVHRELASIREQNDHH